MGLRGWGIGRVWEGWGAIGDVGEQGRVGEATGKDRQFLGDGWRVTRIDMAVTETMERDGARGASLDLYLPSPVDNCSITWAVFIAGDYNLLMLVEIVGPTSSKYFQVVSYDLGNCGIIGGC